MADFSNMPDVDLINWMTNLINVAETDPAKYGLTAAQIANVTTKRDKLQTKVTARQAADDAALAATAAQKTERFAVLPDLSSINATVKANKQISDADKLAIGITPNKPPTYSTPLEPTGLTVNGYQSNVNILKWNRAGNKPVTMFIIEWRKENEPDFKYLDTTTETSYEQKNVKPGERAFYRVKAKRGGEESSWSNEAVVY